MEEHYDGDTVELIDYLRVMWWGKWIILGCLVVAVGLSALFVGLQSKTYSGSTEILLREYVSAALAEDRDATIIMTAEPDSTMADVVDSTLSQVENSVRGIAASVEDDRITLSHSDAASTDDVREALAQAVVELERQLLLALTEEIQHLAHEAQLQKTGLTAQLEILQRRLGEEQASGETPLSEALAERVADVAVQLAQKQAHLDTLEGAEPGDLFVLSALGEPTILASESSFKTTIAIAGFLGLMLGVLLAFFVHYLLQIHARERDEEKAKNT